MILEGGISIGWSSGNSAKSLLFNMIYFVILFCNILWSICKKLQDAERVFGCIIWNILQFMKCFYNL